VPFLVRLLGHAVGSPQGLMDTGQLRSCQRISPDPRRFETFRNNKNIFGEMLLTPRPTPKLEDHEHRKTRTSVHASSRIRTHDRSVQAAQYHSRLRPHGDWDRPD